MAPMEYGSDTELGTSTLICGWIFGETAVLMFGLMAKSRRLLRKRFGIEEYLVFISLLISIALATQTNWAIVDEGQGRHIEDESPIEIVLVAKSLWAHEILWSTMNTLLRVSVLLAFRHVFLFHHYIYTALILLSILYGIVVLLESLLVCRPLSSAWNPYANGCGDEILIFVVFEGIGLLIDVMILLFPSVMIWKLYMTTGRKLKMIAAICVGGIILIITVLRIEAFREAGSTDITYSKCYLGLLSEIGAFLGIIAYCVPLSMPAFRQTGAWASRFRSLMTIFGRSNWTQSISRRTRGPSVAATFPERSQLAWARRLENDRWMNAKYVGPVIYPFSYTGGPSVIRPHLPDIVWPAVPVAIGSQQGVELRGLTLSTVKWRINRTKTRKPVRKIMKTRRRVPRGSNKVSYLRFLTSISARTVRSIRRRKSGKAPDRNAPQTQYTLLESQVTAALRHEGCSCVTRFTWWTTIAGHGDTVGARSYIAYPSWLLLRKLLRSANSRSSSQSQIEHITYDLGRQGS